MDKIIIKCFDDLKGYYKTGKEKFYRTELSDYYEISDGKNLMLRTEKNEEGLKMIVDMLNRFDGNLEYRSKNKKIRKLIIVFSPDKKYKKISKSI